MWKQLFIELPASDLSISTICEIRRTSLESEKSIISEREICARSLVIDEFYFRTWKIEYTYNVMRDVPAIFVREIHKKCKIVTVL